MLQRLRDILNYFRLDLARYPSSDLRRRMMLFDFYKIDKVLDVGANIGQYARTLRKIGYTGEIISFEPVSNLFLQLQNRAKRDGKWRVYNYGLGDKSELKSIYLSQNTYSSSLLSQTDELVELAPESKYIGSEKITLKKLDDIFKDLTEPGENVFLKMDVQGYEKNILKGANDSLQELKGIQLEMSIDQLYEGETLFQELLTYIEARQFKLQSLENGFYNTTSGKLLQVDGIFFKED